MTGSSLAKHTSGSVRSQVSGPCPSTNTQARFIHSRCKNGTDLREKAKLLSDALSNCDEIDDDEEETKDAVTAEDGDERGGVEEKGDEDESAEKDTKDEDEDDAAQSAAVAHALFPLPLTTTH